LLYVNSYDDIDIYGDDRNTLHFVVIVYQMSCYEIHKYLQENYLILLCVQEMNAGDEQRMKREVLLSVSVVCTTLNHSGSSLLLDVLKPFTNSGRATVPFGCIIVDEVQD